MQFQIFILYKLQIKLMKQQCVQIGLTSFSSQINKQEFSVLIKTLTQPAVLQWNIKDQQYKVKQWDKLFLKIRQTKIQHISLWRIDRKEIVKQLSHIQFTNLLKLNISFNNINNIQELAHLNAPQLTHLSLAFNKLNSLKGFNKARIDKLTEFLIYQNPLKVVQLAKAKTASIIKKMFYGYCWDPVLDEDSSKLAKIEANDISQLWLGSQDRIRQPKCDQILKKKFLHTKITRFGKRTPTLPAINLALPSTKKN